MNLSIKTKLFVMFNLLIVFFVIMALSWTSLGLEKFYIWQKKNTLITVGQTIDSLYQGDPVEIDRELEKAINTLGANILILGPNGELKYSSFGHMNTPKPPAHLPRPPLPPDTLADEKGLPLPFPPSPPHLLKASEIVDEHSKLEIQQDLDLQIDFIVLEQQLSAGDTLVIRQPLAPISESAALATQFILVTGIFSLLLGCLWAFLFTRKFTAPILEISRIAQSMAQLDFSQKCTLTRRDEIGELGHSINHLSDQLDRSIAELNYKNKQLQADVEKERSLDKMRREFVSNVSHELKTPLSLILGYAEGLKENVTKDEASKNDYCAVIIDEAEKMDKLIKDLLNLSQIEAGVFELTRSDFSFSNLLVTIATKYQSVLTEKGVTLQITDNSTTNVNGDELRIEQVLLNFFINALNHVDAKKIITIETEDRLSHLRVKVYNSGQKIPEESLSKIWTSFYKVDKARTRSYGGYGLGLSIVRAIQELHKNNYGVTNYEQGVCFWFDLNKSVPKSLNK